MSKHFLVLALAIGLPAFLPAESLAVNCEVVRKDLKLGRWPEDVALGHGITLSQVKSCQDSSKQGSATPPPSNAKPAPKSSSSSEKSSDSRR
jgi:hypothetical protein